MNNVLNICSLPHLLYGNVYCRKITFHNKLLHFEYARRVTNRSSGSVYRPNFCLLEWGFTLILNTEMTEVLSVNSRSPWTNHWLHMR